MVSELDGGVGSAHNVHLTVITLDHGTGTHTLILSSGGLTQWCLLQVAMMAISQDILKTCS